MSTLSYEQKLEIANKYLLATAGIEWDDLPDVNSLHDCDDEEEIKNACADRLSEDGLNDDFFGDDDAD